MTLMELRSLWQIVKGVPAGADYAARLNAFYRPQTATYDARHAHKRLGRDVLLNSLALAPGSRVVELGAGTGGLLDLWGSRLSSLAALELVDICPVMLEKAHHRARLHANVRVVQCDASEYRAPWPADCVYFSYSLTMIPDWLRALNNALRMLKPGGKLGIVDFYVTPADSQGTEAQHSALTQWFWTHWFRHDQVNLAPQHVSALCALTDRLHLHEGTSALPYVPLLRAPYFVYVGVKPAQPRWQVMTDLWKKSAALP